MSVCIMVCMLLRLLVAQMLKRSATGGLLLRVGLCEILKVYISNGFCVWCRKSLRVQSTLLYYTGRSHTVSHSLRRLSASRQ